MEALIPLIIASVTLTGYLILIIKKIGVQKSISFSDVVLQKPFKMCFEFTMWVCGLCLFWFGTSQGILLTQIGGLCICMVGCFTKITKARWIYVTHMFFAVSGFTLVALSFWLNLGQWYISSAIALLVVIAAIFSKNKIWGVEVVLAYSIFIGMVYDVLK